MKLFKRNMGNIDRGIRISVGLVILFVGPIGQFMDLTTASDILLGILGFFALLSGLSGYCMFYDWTGSNTTKSES